MRTSLSAALLTTTMIVMAGSCSSGDALSEPATGPQMNSNAIQAIEQCQPVMSIEVVHRVDGRPVTDRIRLTDEAAADPESALRSFKLAADHFGAGNVISSQPISQVYCFPQQIAQPSTAKAARSKRPLLSSDAELCADRNGVLECSSLTPTHIYDYGGGENCSVTDYTGARTLSCEDSSVIITKNGDVVLTINTETLRAEIAARTQALRRLVGDANVITNFHFDVVITPQQRASLVGNDAYSNIARQIKQASDNGQPLPDIAQILRNLPQPPQNFEFYTQLLEAYQTKQERLNALAQITSGNLLSPQQVNAFYQNFVSKSRLVDRLDVNHSASALNQATDIINDTISQLATNDPSSTIYNQVKAGGQSMLAAHAPNGVFDPDHAIDFAVPDLRQSLTSADIEKRLASSGMMIELNEVLRRSDGRGRDLAYAMAGSLGLLAKAIENDNMDQAWRLYDQVQATEFFFDNDNPEGTSYNVHLTPEAQALYGIQVRPNSSIAYEVINLLNESAEYNAATGRLTLDYRAIITINARQALNSNDIQRTLYHTEEAYGLLGFLRNAAPAFLGGALKELGSTVSGVLYTAAAFWSDPEGFIDHLKSAVVNWRQTLDLVLAQGIEVIQRWPNMTTEERAELLGRIATQVLLSLPAEARTASRLNQALEDAVKLHLEKASKGLQLIERGGVALSEETAVELVKRMEALELSTIDEMLEVAGGIDDFLPCSLVAVVPRGALTAMAVKPPCTLAQLARALAMLEQQVQNLGIRGTRAVKDGIIAAAKSGLHPIGNNLWESGAGLRYGADAEFGNRVIHILNHAVDNSIRALHGVFDDGPRGALSVVDEGWRQVLIPGNPDVRIIIQDGASTTYEVYMHRRIGYVGGTQGAANGRPDAEYLRIAVRNNTSDIITAFPARRK